jgi:glycosyltransferase involved in cell wall biosynthesis
MSGPLRIVMATGLYSPVIGGMERHVQSLAEELVHRGHSVAVVTLRHDGTPRFAEENGVRIHRVDGWTRALDRFYEDRQRRFHPPITDPLIAQRLAAVVRAERASIVHAHDWMLYSLLPAKHRLGVKVVATLHDFSLLCVKKTYLHKGQPCTGPAFARCISCGSEQYGAVKSLALTTALRASSMMHQLVDRYIAVSHAIGDAFTAHGRARESALSVIPSFAEPSVPGAARPGFVPASGGFILFAGALGPHKGLDVLLEAYRSLNRNVPLVLAGTRRHDTPEFPAGVVVAEDVPHRDVLAAWEHSLLGVAPSTCVEGFGISAVEAMAAGRPVVASAIGGLRDIVVDGETGILCAPGDADELRNALRRLLDDDDARATMGAAARERAAAFSLARVTTQIEAVYADVVAAAAAM